MLGAQAIGILAVLVRTGTYREAALTTASGPDLMVDSIGEVAQLLE